MSCISHCHQPQAHEGAVPPSKDLSPGPAGSELEVSFSFSEGLCLTVPSSHPSSLVLHLDPVDIYSAVVPPWALLPKVCRERKYVFLHQAFRNLNFSLCLKWKRQTSKLNVSREQQLSNCEIHSNSAENVSSCLFPFWIKLRIDLWVLLCSV